MSSNRRFFYYWVPFLLYAASILILSSFSSVPGVHKGTDKFLHTIEYAIFAFLLYRAIAGERFFQADARRLLTTFFCSSLFGAIDESYQMMVPGRFSSIFDWFADVAGISGMITLVLIAVRIKERSLKNYGAV